MLKRPIYPMPDYIYEALVQNDLYEAYKSRPAYQRNDYIGWIIRAKQESTKQKRLNQMLDELRSNERYMNMVYRPKDN
jgi:uncharacterized protein YdeI (YjbR/CyaY-like superfamily)